MRVVLYTISLLVVLVSSSIADTGKVIRVTDGDTIIVVMPKKTVSVRLYGIDCPEYNQHMGCSAKSFTEQLVLNKIVTVNKITVDRYGRLIADIIIDNESLSEELVKVGYAWVYTKYCDSEICQQWQKYEEKAKSKRFGIWAKSNPTPPWDFRKQQKQEDTKYESKCN